jgi:hypothetical protein
MPVLNYNKLEIPRKVLYYFQQVWHTKHYELQMEFVVVPEGIVL